MKEYVEQIKSNKTALIIIAAILAALLVIVLLPQSFWVNISIKFFG